MLWYRKSFAQKAGLDMSQPVTWDQIIQAAADNGGTVAVQANKYEGYVVWINALVSGAGGTLVTDAAKGIDANIDDQQPGRRGRGGGDRGARPLQGRSTGPVGLQRGQAGATFGTPKGAFMVNWTYICHNYDTTQPDVAKDIGYARYPETVQASRPGLRTAASASGSAPTPSHIDEANQAAACLVEPKQQSHQRRR